MQCLLEVQTRAFKGLGLIDEIHQRSASQIRLVSLRILRVAPLHGVFLLGRKLQVEGLRNLQRRLVLQGEDIFQVANKIIGPGLKSG